MRSRRPSPEHGLQAASGDDRRRGRPQPWPRRRDELRPTPAARALLKGALVVFETAAPIPTNLIAFQYNPDSVSRTLRAAAATGATRGAKRGDTDARPARPDRDA